MKGSSVLKFLLLLSGWAVAAWLFIAKPLAPIPLVPGAANEAASPESALGEGEKIFHEWSADPALAGALVGFCLIDESGGTLYASPLAETALCPASALKTVTTGAAFELLGPEFRFVTVFSATGPINSDGTLEGDLGVVGYGDPTLTTADLEALADELVKSGVKRIAGRLLPIDSLFPQSAVNDHWNWGDIGNAYGAGAYPVNVDHNRLSIRFRPGKNEGEPAAFLGMGPVAKGTRAINRVTTGARGSGDRVVVYSEPGGRTITMEGTVPAGESEFTVSGAIPDPPALAAEILRSRFEASGVKFLGRDVFPNIPNSMLPMHISPPLPEIIDHLHKVSDNLEAQSLFLSIGLKEKADPAEAIRRHWESRGVTFTGLRLIDGSGLARANMIRPLDLARVNHAARRGPHGDRFRESLSAYLGGRVRSKLGAMSGVKTEVGFLTLPDGRELTFALMANGLGPEVDFWPLREKLLSAVASKFTR